MSQARIEHPYANVAATFEVPDGFRAVDRLVPNLVYPSELVSVLNVDLPETPPEWKSVHDDVPRVDLLPSHGALVWAVLYDDVPESAPRFSKQRQGRTVRGGSLPSGGVATRWESANEWRTSVKLDDTRSCQIFAFAGRGNAQARNAVRRISESFVFDV
jgi:hypothetical protein